MRLRPALAPLLLLAPLASPATMTVAETPATAGFTDRLASDAEAAWVPFDLTPGNQIRFTLEVDGNPVTAILDTGVSVSVLSRAFVDARRLKVRSGGSASAIGGAVPIGWITTRTIRLGGLTRSGGRIGVTALPATATGSARPIEMLVGRDLTEGYALDVDYAARRFRLIASGRMPFNGASAPLSVSSERLVYTGEIVLNGRRLRPLIVDTGDGNAITLSAESWATARLIPPARTSTISFGLGGAITTDLVILDDVKIGSLVARNVELQIEPSGGFSQRMGMTGRIGSGLLQKYRVLLDPKAGRMVLAPGPDADAVPVKSTSGILVAAEKDRLRVLHVMRGSPAERAGWRTGETICMIDGSAVPADYPGSALSTWSIGATGRVVRLDMCDGTRRTLTLRPFY